MPRKDLYREGLWVAEYNPHQRSFHVDSLRRSLGTNQKILRKHFTQDDPPKTKAGNVQRQRLLGSFVRWLTGGSYRLLGGFPKEEIAEGRDRNVPVMHNLGPKSEIERRESICL